MLQALRLAVQFGTGSDEALSDLEKELLHHRRRVAVGRGLLGDRCKLCQSGCASSGTKRPWLEYDPDALLPSPFDGFLLSGVVPRIPWQPSSEDVFIVYIVGCGRSGTTIVAELLSRYYEVVVLNEPRQLWLPVLPSMDVWSVSAAKQCRLVFEASQALENSGSASVAEQICFAYRDVSQLVHPVGGSMAGRRRVIVEKFPEHCFRLPFLEAVCTAGLGPERCVFLHVVRNGVDVARSIASFENLAAWYGVKGDAKWRELSRLIEPLSLGPEFRRRLDNSHEPAMQLFCRGLVEWALCLQAGRAGMHAVGSPSLEIRYEDLLAEPVATMQRVESICGLSATEELRRLIPDLVHAREPKLPSEAEEQVLAELRGSQIEELLVQTGSVLRSGS